MSININKLNTLTVSKVQVELSTTLLVKLLNSGLLHGSECKCLNMNAKKALWQAVLASSVETSFNKEDSLCA